MLIIKLDSVTERFSVGTSWVRMASAFLESWTALEIGHVIPGAMNAFGWTETILSTATCTMSLTTFNAARWVTAIFNHMTKVLTVKTLRWPTCGFIWFFYYYFGVMYLIL
ncbi:uncharacterized protein LOC112694055 [Sipha flava]|uniref:Uncharacterized protein LOC112694055 n=1 Tax=Sipha flava TaxID=143950 RepID=A0A8B8GRF1_9HEMI|nr:uncharacterized protein LOC112694055 [Sipha flava]